jgi:hypothetical protein
MRTNTIYGVLEDGKAEINVLCDSIKVVENFNSPEAVCKNRPKKLAKTLCPWKIFSITKRLSYIHRSGCLMWHQQKRLSQFASPVWIYSYKAIDSFENQGRTVHNTSGMRRGSTQWSVSLKLQFQGCWECYQPRSGKSVQLQSYWRNATCS